MISKLLTLAILLAVVYLILTEALPLLTGGTAGGGAKDGTANVTQEDARCIEQAERAEDRLTSAARQFGQPPVDLEAWSGSMWEIESQLQTAASACLCGSQACEAGGRAVDEMRELLSNLDGMVRGDSPGFANPANQQERILRHLETARDAAGL